MTDYHWSPANQRGFLETLAQSGNITQAARAVGMSAQAAYAFAARAAGRVFALGWDAAVLIARRRVEGDMLQRALEGQEELYERDADTGIVKRTRINNGTTMAMLKRLDAMVAGKGDAPADAAMARIVAQDFEHFLDLIEEGGSGAEAMLFLKARDGELLPMAHIPTAIAALEFAKDHQLSQKNAVSDEAEEDELSPEEEADQMHVWFCEHTDGWRTNFPPPDSFCGEEDLQFGDDGYSRELDEEEMEHFLAIRAVEAAQLRAAGEAARRAWFGIVETKACPISVISETTELQPEPLLEPETEPEAEPELQPEPEIQQHHDALVLDVDRIECQATGTGTILDASLGSDRNRPEVITHRPVYLNPPINYGALGQIPPWAERIC
jgi:transposase